MMRLDLITLFPAMFQTLQWGINQKAFRQASVTINLWNPRDYSDHPLGYVDDRPYGGGPGMVMQAAPLTKTLHTIQNHRPHPAPVILLSPTGPTWQQKHAQAMSNSRQGAVFICGRYEGIDQRFIDQHVHQCYSVGDFILSGGELGCLIIIDTLLRLLPNTLNNPNSNQNESFAQQRLAHPHYTRPQNLHGQKVPPILLQGNHQNIARWRQKQSLIRTYKQRPDLIQQRKLDVHEKKLLNTYVKERSGDLDVDT
jgi:tRNA (guanine37-N1)-methyltransferase